MSHSRIGHREEVDSWLLMVGSQIVNLTPGPSFANNLGDRCPNDQCEAIFDIYVSIPFQWHQEHLNARCFGPCCRALNIRESRRTPNPNSFQVLGFALTLGQVRVATISALNNDTKGSCTISKLGVDDSGMLIRLVQTKIGIDRLVCNAIKLSSSRGIHQCSKQDIRRFSPIEDYCIFRVNTIRHKESTEARNKTAQEHYGRKMTMFLRRTTKLYDPKNLTSNLQELEGINICFSHRNNWCSQQWHERILHN
jgi:hypothetical protein